MYPRAASMHWNVRAGPSSRALAPPKMPGSKRNASVS